MTDRTMSPLQHEEGLINPYCHLRMRERAGKALMRSKKSWCGRREKPYNCYVIEIKQQFKIEPR